MELWTTIQHIFSSIPPCLAGVVTGSSDVILLVGEAPLINEIVQEYHVILYRLTWKPTYDTWVGSWVNEFEANWGKNLGGVCVWKFYSLDFLFLRKCVHRRVKLYLTKAWRASALCYEGPESFRWISSFLWLQWQIEGDLCSLASRHQTITIGCAFWHGWQACCSEVHQILNRDSRF